MSGYVAEEFAFVKAGQQDGGAGLFPGKRDALSVAVNIVDLAAALGEQLAHKPVRKGHKLSQASDVPRCRLGRGR